MIENVTKYLFAYVKLYGNGIMLETNITADFDVLPTMVEIKGRCIDYFNEVLKKQGKSGEYHTCVVCNIQFLSEDAYKQLFAGESGETTIIDGVI